MANRQDLIRAVDLAIAGDWDGAHKIVQEDEADATSCWIHAVLHKIEGDAGNSRYWYARAGQSYEAYPDAKAELPPSRPRSRIERLLLTLVAREPRHPLLDRRGRGALAPPVGGPGIRWRARAARGRSGRGTSPSRSAAAR